MNKNPILLIGAVLAIALIGGSLFYGCSSTPSNNGTTNKPPATTAAAPPPAAKQTIPPGAPPGAEPPEQMGSPNAAVTLEEFADFQCGSCAAAHPAMNEIKGMYGTRIHFIFRNFPLQIAAHDKAYEAALAASAAGMQGKFWDMQNILFSNQKTWSSDPTYKEIWKGYAQKIGLNMAKWETDMGGLGAKTRVEKDIERGKAVGINSTPTLFMNGTAVPFADMKVDSLKALIDAELQKAPGQNPAANKEAAPVAKSGNSNK
jgi:protein-disulfide isomerase